MIAGEPERISKAKRLVSGIPVDPTTWGEIIAAGAKVGLAQSDVERAAGI